MPVRIEVEGPRTCEKDVRASAPGEEELLALAISKIITTS